MNLEILYALALFFAGGLGYALGRVHAHETFNRVVGTTMDTVLLHLRVESREMRIGEKGGHVDGPDSDLHGDRSEEAWKH